MLKKRADGRFCKTVTIEGQRQFIYGDTEAEVDDKYLELKMKLKKGMQLDDSITLGELAVEWYDTYIKDCRAQKTQEMYKTILNNHIARFAHYKLKDIKPLMIDKYLKKLGKSKSLEHKIRITLNQIFKLAKANKIIDYNPMEHVKPTAKGDPRSEFLNTQQRDIVLAALKGHRSHLYVFTLLNTGMRRGEALALTWDDFDYTNSVIYVVKAIEWVEGKPEVKEPKTKAGIRSIPIPEELRDALKYEKDHRKSISPYIFPHENGGMHTKTSEHNLWETIKAKVDKYLMDYINKDIKDEDQKVNISLTYRALRHTYATALYDAGIDLKSAQEILGHADFKITMNIYTHIQNERREKNIIKIQDLYGKKEAEKTAQNG
jgi:integrase